MKRGNVRPLTVGVLGGMGPLATADFYTKLVRLTPARTDQDHLHVIIDSNPHIPDRTAAVLAGGPDPAPALAASARRLVQAGAELIAVPCNSAHAFLEEIREAAGVPVLDMMEEVAAVVAARTPRPDAVGLLATSGTLASRLYHRPLAERGIGVLEPDPDEQQRLMAAIYAVKAGDLGEAVRGTVRQVALSLHARGAPLLVLGCTELPLVLDPGTVPVPVVDATEVLARATLREATGGESGRPSQRFGAVT